MQQTIKKKRKDTRDRTQYYINNKEKINTRSILWAKCNPEKRSEIRKRYHTKHPQAKIAYQLRIRITNALKGRTKFSKFKVLTGLTSNELKLYLETLFKPGMSWDNYGEWYIDHIRPCASFDLSIPEHQLECFNYKNLQPLWALENKKKSDKYQYA